MDISQLHTYFQENREEIVEGHIGEYVVIHDLKASGYFASEEKALDFCSNNKYELGKFIIKRCLTEKEDLAQRFYSRVSFA